LNILEGFDLVSMEYGSAPYYHLLIEATKQAFADRNRYVADPAFADLPIDSLLSKAYAKARRQEMSRERAGLYKAGSPLPFGNTVYVSCVDREGNVVSLINSLFAAFGSGVVAGDTGICLQNRGAGFVADTQHPNALAPGKRPLHTIIPAMILKDDRPWVCFGVMGGDVQPQGHTQVAINLIDFQMNVRMPSRHRATASWAVSRGARTRHPHEVAKPWKRWGMSCCPMARCRPARRMAAARRL
jgi:gamma-glutamyltranspeptidase/glutathione hydrolase